MCQREGGRVTSSFSMSPATLLLLCPAIAISARPCPVVDTHWDTRRCRVLQGGSSGPLCSSKTALVHGIAVTTKWKELVKHEQDGWHVTDGQERLHLWILSAQSRWVGTVLGGILEIYRDSVFPL